MLVLRSDLKTDTFVNIVVWKRKKECSFTSAKLWRYGVCWEFSV